MTQHAAPLAVVTGASSGIGLELARVLARRGLRTVLIARREDKLEALAVELSAYAPSTALPLDLAATDTIAPAMEKLLATHGCPDVLVNNAGAGIYEAFTQLTLKQRQQLLQVNLISVIEITHALLPAMLAAKRGHIINIASMSGKFGPWGHSVYAAAKAGVIALSQSLAIELENTGVNVSYVNPGLVDTEYFCNPGYVKLYSQIRKRVISPQYTARRIATLLDKPRLEMCIPASYRFMDVICAIHPRLAKWIVSSESRPRGETTAHPSTAEPARDGAAARSSHNGD